MHSVKLFATLVAIFATTAFLLLLGNILAQNLLS